MKEFVFGTKEQFDYLDRELQDHMCHKFNGCRLPVRSDPETMSIGFEVSRTGDYILYIDYNVKAETGNPDLQQLLENGELRFLCMDDVMEFFHSLQYLYPNSNELAKIEQTPPEQEEDPTPVCDYEKVRKLQEEQDDRMIWPEDIADPLKKKVFGQDEAIDEIANKIVANRMRKEKKLLVIALIGPTATGKSETAKSLAQVMSRVYGTNYGFIEIAGSEFVGEHSVNRFFGAPAGYVGYGNETVFEPVRKNPRHVLVINEMEKADPKILTGLMEAIDTGYIGMADNSKPIDLNECILFFTSNLPIDVEEYNGLSKFERSEMCRDAFTKFCGRPEISGKIGNFIVFNKLSDKANMEIVAKFVREELRSYDLKLVSIEEGLMVDFLKRRTKYGARGIRELVSGAISERLLGERELEKYRNKSVALKGTIDDIQFEIAS